jgi:hypothetical protein
VATQPVNFKDKADTKVKKEENDENDEGSDSSDEERHIIIFIQNQLMSNHHDDWTIFQCAIGGHLKDHEYLWVFTFANSVIDDHFNMKLQYQVSAILRYFSLLLLIICRAEKLPLSKNISGECLAMTRVGLLE